ncbi:MAG: nucleotide pyrophosphohydrolase [Aureliella sp.]
MTEPLPPDSLPAGSLPPDLPPSSQPERRAAEDSGDRGEQPALDDRNATVWQLRELMRQFVRERQWERFHNAKNLAMSLAIEAGELMEHFQWHTTDQVVASEGLDLAGIRDELADVLCYGLSLANALDIDIAQAIEQKMVKNRHKYPAP